MAEALTLPRVAAALAAGTPPGPLAAVTLPTLRSTSGAVLHSRDNADACRELSLWGWPGTGSVELTTVAALTQDQFPTAAPTLKVCDRCVGEDSDLVGDYAAAAAGTATALALAREYLADLEAAVASGAHLLLAGADPYGQAQRYAWTRLRALRVQLDPAFMAPVVRPTLLRHADQLADLDADLGRWLTDWTGPALTRVRELMEAMRTETAPETAAPTLVVRLGSSNHAAGDRTAGFDPVGWLPTAFGTCPVYRMDGPVPDGSSALNLGADPGPGPAAVAARLDATARLLQAAPAGTPLRDVRTAYEAATDLAQ